MDVDDIRFPDKPTPQMPTKLGRSTRIGCLQDGL